MKKRNVSAIIHRNFSILCLNDMFSDTAVQKAIAAIPRSQRNRRIRKFVSMANKRGISPAILNNVIGALQ